MRLAFVLLLAALALAGCTPAADRAEPVGRLHRAWVDQARTDWAGSGSRPLAVTFWYPAAPGSVESAWHADIFRFGRNAVDAPYADAQKRPLIVLSHGTGGSAAQLSWLAEGLVEAGFVVAAVNHHGNTAAEERRWPHGFALPAERARDVSVLIDRLLAAADLAAHVDPARIGVAGFSLGGYTALAAAGAHLEMAQRELRCRSRPGNPVCALPPEADFSEADLAALAASDAAFRRALARDGEPVHDRRIRAVYAITPAFVSIMERDDFALLEVPTRIVLAEADEQILHAETLASLRANLPQASTDTVADAGHYAFLAPCSLRGRIFVSALCRDASGIDRDELHARISRDAAAFFAASL